MILVLAGSDVSSLSSSNVEVLSGNTREWSIHRVNLAQHTIIADPEGINGPFRDVTLSTVKAVQESLLQVDVQP